MLLELVADPEVAIPVEVLKEVALTLVEVHLHGEEHLEVDDQEEVFQPLQEEGLELEEAILVVAVQEEDLLGHSEHLEEGLPSLEHQVEDHEWELHDP